MDIEEEIQESAAFGPRFPCFWAINSSKESGAANQLRLFVMRSESGRREEPKAGQKGRAGRASQIWIGPHMEMSEEIITLSAIGSRKGDAAEAEFMARACSLNFRVAKPWGNIDPYDVLVGAGRGFWRVQVKCAFAYGYGYSTSMSNVRSVFRKGEVDFIAVWVADQNIWYIVPVEAVDGKSRLTFFPGRRARGGRKNLERYREAWCLLACPPKARGWKDAPVVCRCRGQLPTLCAVCPRRNETASRRDVGQ